jgi:16S rRNA (uracil1498-N3)-methyltransferase
MNLFYSYNLQNSNVLPEEESAHAIKVLRLKCGDEIDIIDGQGLFCKAKITLMHPKHCEFQVFERISDKNPRKHNLHIAIAPTKNIDRFEWFVEKATEIGIDRITPLLCRFSERKTLKIERLEKIIVAACKQSQQLYFPKIEEIINFDSFLQQTGNNNAQKFIAHCYPTEKPLLKNICLPAKDTIILIGAEGDFSIEEIALAQKYGFIAVSLGNSRLRTETAGIVACATFEFVSRLNDKHNGGLL